jgi:adenine deaminase
VVEGERIAQVLPAWADFADFTARRPGEARVLELEGRYLAPGFLDAHLHIESSMLTPLEFARVAVIHGTTGVFVDPHEIANVQGRRGIALFLEQAPLLPLDLYLGVPACVPATDLEDAGAAIGLQDVAELLEHPRVFGLAEMMNFPGIIHGFGGAREKVALTLARGGLVDGHAPGLRGEALRRYVSNGAADGVVRIGTDHESTTAEEALDKLAAGMTLALRYGSASKDLPRLLPPLLAAGAPLERLMLCSDDLDAAELTREGHLDRILRVARRAFVEAGTPPEEAACRAIALATLHPAACFAPFFRRHGLPLPGEIAPGRKANLVVLRSLETFAVETVLHGGRVVVEQGRCVPLPDFDDGPWLAGPQAAGGLAVGRTFAPADFRVACEEGAAPDGRAGDGEVRVRAIGLGEGIVTEARTVPAQVQGGEVLLPPSLAKIAVIERHRATGTFAVGFVERCLAAGAIASTVAHDSHNLIAIGVDDEALARAVNHLIAHGGGMVVAGRGLTRLPLPLAGLMSNRPASEVAAGLLALEEALAAIGAPPHLFMQMSFLALPVLPSLRITNRGLVDVDAFAHVPVCA